MGWVLLLFLAWLREEALVLSAVLVGGGQLLVALVVVECGASRAEGDIVRVGNLVGVVLRREFV